MLLGLRDKLLVANEAADAAHAHEHPAAWPPGGYDADDEGLDPPVDGLRAAVPGTVGRGGRWLRQRSTWVRGRLALYWIVTVLDRISIG